MLFTRQFHIKADTPAYPFFRYCFNRNCVPIYIKVDDTCNSYNITIVSRLICKAISLLNRHRRFIVLWGTFYGVLH